jgi:hypothetical protein
MLGAFGFLGVTKNKRQFLCYIPFAFEQLARHLSKFGRMRLPLLDKLVSAIRRHGLNYRRSNG